MQLINEALEVLTNENKRKDFDLKLNSFNQQKQKERFSRISKRKKYEDFQQQEKNSRKFSKMMIKIRKKPKILISILISIFQKGFIFLSHFKSLQCDKKK